MHCQPPSVRGVITTSKSSSVVSLHFIFFVRVFVCASSGNKQIERRIFFTKSTTVAFMFWVYFCNILLLYCNSFTSIGTLNCCSMNIFVQCLYPLLVVSMVNVPFIRRTRPAFRSATPKSKKIFSFILLNKNKTLRPDKAKHAVIKLFQRNPISEPSFCSTFPGFVVVIITSIMIIVSAVWKADFIAFNYSPCC